MGSQKNTIWNPGITEFKLFLIIVIIGFFLTTISCTKEITDSSSSNQNSTEIDLTGEWNAYGYLDNNGRVPLEIIRIEKTGSGNEYTATKILGDNSVPSGEVTWKGKFNQNPFMVTVWYGDGVRFTSSENNPMEVISENVLSLLNHNILYVRRGESYFP